MPKLVLPDRAWIQHGASIFGNTGRISTVRVQEIAGPIGVLACMSSHHMHPASRYSRLELTRSSVSAILASSSFWLADPELGLERIE